MEAEKPKRVFKKVKYPELRLQKKRSKPGRVGRPWIYPDTFRIAYEFYIKYKRYKSDCFDKNGWEMYEGDNNVAVAGIYNIISRKGKIYKAHFKLLFPKHSLMPRNEVKLKISTRTSYATRHWIREQGAYDMMRGIFFEDIFILKDRHNKI